MGVGKFLRNCGHKAVDYTVPRNATIALMTTGAGLYGPMYTKTYAPGWLVSVFQGAVEKESNKICNLPGCQTVSNIFSHFSAPIVVTKTTTELEGPVGAIAALVTCVTLNAITALIYGPVDSDANEVKSGEIKCNVPKVVLPLANEPPPPYSPSKNETPRPQNYEEVTIDILPDYKEVYCKTE